MRRYGLLKKLFPIIIVIFLIVALAGCQAASEANVVNGELGAQDSDMENSSEAITNTQILSDGMQADCIITLSDSEITASGKGVETEEDKIIITAGGIYEITGVVSDGRIVADAEGEEITLILNGVSITSSEYDAIFVKNASDATVILAEGSENTLTSGSADAMENDPDTTVDFDNKQKACLMAKCNLLITGNGSLTVNGYINNGIHSKGSLVLSSEQITVAALNDGIKAAEELNIISGTYTVMTNGDAITSDSTLTIEDGVYTITTGSGAGEMAVSSQGMPEAGFEPGMQPQMPSGMPGNDGQIPQMPGDGRIPQMPGGMNDTDNSSDDSVSQKGIKSETQITITGGTFTLDTADDSIHCNGSISISVGQFTIATGDDGIHADNELTVDGGKINITQCYEGLEGLTVTINAGDISVIASDDGINANGDKDDETWIMINGGDIYVDASGDGLDSNGSITVNGGRLIVDGPASGADSAIDYGSENGGIFVINGGEIIAFGTSEMLEAIDASSAQTSIMFVFSQTLQANTEVVVTDASGNEILAFTNTKSGNSVIISNSSMKTGETYTFTYSGISESITADSVNVTNYTGGMGGPGGGMGGTGGPGGDFRSNFGGDSGGARR